MNNKFYEVCLYGYEGRETAIHYFVKEENALKLANAYLNVYNDRHEHEDLEANRWDSKDYFEELGRIEAALAKKHGVEEGDIHAIISYGDGNLKTYLRERIFSDPELTDQYSIFNKEV